MSTANQALGYRFAEILNGHDAGRFADLIASNYVNHNLYVEQGQAGVIAFFSHGWRHFLTLTWPSRT